MPRPPEPRKSLLRFPVYGCFLALLLGIGGTMVYRFATTGRVIKDSAGYRVILARAHADAGLRAALGGDFREPRLVRGTFTRNARDEVELELWAILRGPVRTGELHATALERPDGWVVARARVAIPPGTEDGSSVDLVAPTSSRAVLR